MAKKSKVAKNNKQRKLVMHYAELRKQLKEQGDYEGLNKLPKDSAAIRLKNRCALTGRPRGLHAEVWFVPHRFSGTCP